MTSTRDATVTREWLPDKRVAFVGKLGAMSRKEACGLLKQFGAMPLDRISNDADLVVIGAEELPEEDIEAMLNARLRERIRDGNAYLIHEHDLWLELELLEDSSSQLYTPAMVAGLIKTPVRDIRRWHRLGLLESVKVAHRLPYFDFAQVQAARRLAAWVASGARPTELHRQLKDFGPRIADRRLIDLDLVFDGRKLLLRESGKLMGATGQLHLDFEGLEVLENVSESGQAHDPPVTVPWPLRSSASPDAGLGASASPMTREEMIQAAEEWEDQGQWEPAIEWYRVMLAQYGPQAEIVFQLAELLYRSGDVSAARERYYNAIELDEDFVEARVNLGCVLAETGQVELAIAAFEGALARDDRYPDVHYHLARSLDEVGQSESATRHWLRFVQLSPQSPWAEEALERLGR